MIESTVTKELAHRFMLDDIEINVLKNKIIKNSIEYSLEPRLMRIISLLAKRHGEIVTRSELLSEISEQGFVSDESLTQAMSKIRQIIGDEPRKPRFIKTVPKQGYLLLPPAIPIKNAPSNLALEQRDGRTVELAKKTSWSHDKTKAIVYVALLITCIAILFSIFWPKEQEFIEKGQIEFIEKE